MVHSVAAGVAVTPLYDRRGRRKYLTLDERRKFLRAASQASDEVLTLCQTLAYTGCRLSEALWLTADRVDMADGVLVFESLKRRRRGVYRAVPVPQELLLALDEVHGLEKLGEGRLWAWSRTTAWRRVREVMRLAEVQGPCGSPKGLRHGFGIFATTSQVPLNMTQKWMGHARIETTAIYADAVGPEERQLAQLMWERQ